MKEQSACKHGAFSIASVLEHRLQATAVHLQRRCKKGQRHTACVARTQSHARAEEDGISLPEGPFLSVCNWRAAAYLPPRPSVHLTSFLFTGLPSYHVLAAFIPICILFPSHTALTQLVGAKPSHGAVCLWPSICLQVVNCNFDQSWGLFPAAALPVERSSLIFIDSLPRLLGPLIV